MAEFEAKYTADDIIGLYTLRSQEADEGRVRSLATTFRELCRLDHEVTIPEQYRAISKEVRTPFVRDAWMRITSSMVSKPPLPHITPKDEHNESYRNAANLAERWDVAMIERLNKERGTDIAYNLAAQLVRDGESVLKIVHRPDAWARFPKRASDQSTEDYETDVKDFKHGVDLPFVWRDVDRLSIVYEDGEYGDEWVIEYGEYATPYLRAKYKMVETDDGRLATPGNTLEGRPMPEGLLSTSRGRNVKVEFFDAEEWHVIIDGSEAPGWPKANPYAPYLPYVRARAYDSESLLYSLMFLVPRLDEALTMKLTWSVLGAYANPVIETIPNTAGYPGLDGPLGNAGMGELAEGGEEKPFTWSPGKLMELPLGKRFSFAVPPPVGKDLNDLITLFKNMIDIAGVPSIMRGVAGAGDSGYLANQLHAAAEMAYKLALTALARQLEGALELIHWMVPNVVKQTVYVYGWNEVNPKTGKPSTRASKAWLGLGPEKQTANIADVSKLGPISVQFRPTLPTDEQARAMIAMQLTNAAKPLMSRADALERWLQEEDPEGILQKIYVEDALAQEPLKGKVLEQALRRAGIKPLQPAMPPGASGLVGPNGQPLASPLGTVPPGPNELNPVPLANQAPPGMAGIPGLTMPIAPQAPRSGGIPGNPGGRAAGTFPGQPGNQGR